MDDGLFVRLITQFEPVHILMKMTEMIFSPLCKLAAIKYEAPLHDD
ncbi:Uncharacterised protein [Providencia rustigianii]|uniref:Uncharacterized protein n=2 Tax=Providencia rustigianii TaxID=158850 RepID=D1P2M6_9GAMM|nr:hypothetical protein PROVRUST_06451 [Providencia rustigianii DSM 4541]SPY79090.1 Uncharacterised protein [Providencia rustigianii]SUC28754.1 Uncharacterised protein [Providencia rustigianii]SUC37063.1 Uncharacterised protein [Providencia rustigianii]VEB75855.1 Uncharacterised protein [Providencia rustigianii]